MRAIVAITGASGTAYGISLVKEIAKRNNKLTIIVSENAKKIIAHENGKPEAIFRQLGKFGKLYGDCEIDAPVASGSSAPDAMVVCPCSMKTLSAIANGYSDNLITRAADVMIKEGRKLLLVPRETPLSPVHLENMLKLSRIGVEILPASPAFYHKPKKIDDMINFIVGKILDRLGIGHKLFKRWRD